MVDDVEPQPRQAEQLREHLDARLAVACLPRGHQAGGHAEHPREIQLTRVQVTPRTPDQPGDVQHPSRAAVTLCGFCGAELPCAPSSRRGVSAPGPEPPLVS